MRDYSLNFYMTITMANESDSQGVYVGICHYNEFYAMDEEICDLFNISLEDYYRKVKNAFKNSFETNGQIYYDKIEGSKLERLKANKELNDKYINDLKEKFKEVFCEELILLNLQ